MKTPDQLSVNIDECLQNLFQARQHLHAQIETLIDAKNALDNAKAAAFDAGLIDGKNEDTRKVQYKAHCHAQFVTVEEGERAEREAQFKFECARDVYEVQKLHLRLLELAK